jgi:hypothetical protein
MRVAGQTFGFISRADQLRLRGQRNYNRYMLVVKGFVAGDSLERAQWRKEDAEESQRDADWKRQHGPVDGGASVIQWRHDVQAIRERSSRSAHHQRVSR